MRNTFLVTVSALAIAATSLYAQGPATATATRLLPGTRAGVLSSIQGNAVTSTNGPLANTAVRLRDARTGRIVDTLMTDKDGMFAFRGVDPGSYVVEMMNPGTNTALASSSMLNVSSGEAVSAVVKLPFPIQPFAGAAGDWSQTTGSSLASIATAVTAVTAAALASNTVAQAPVGAPASPTRVVNGR